jgi:replication factor C subunit 3/5
MVLWVDKYRPHSLEKLSLHPELTARLQRLVDGSDFPHLLLYGPSGSGKKTRVNALLRCLFGAGAEKVRVVHKTVKLKSRAVEVATLQSNHHVELTASEAGHNDRHVVQEIIKEIAQTTNVAAAVQQQQQHAAAGAAGSSSSSTGSSVAFKVVVLNEVDRLSMAAQQALRRTMEKYTQTSEHSSRQIAPIAAALLQQL